MDKISELLAEAKPLYVRRQREKKAVITMFFSLFLALGIWAYQPTKVNFDEDGFDTYFTALYMNDFLSDDFADDGIVPVDDFGLIEV